MSKAEIKVTVDHDLDLEAWFDDAMQEVLERSKMRTPVKTGNLQNSITLNKDEKSYSIGSDVDYFPHIEFGTVHIEPFAMVRTSIDELPQILEQKRASLVKK